MSVRQPGDPVTVADAIGDLFSVSNERDRSLALRLQAWREGWLAGHAVGYDGGYLAAVADMKATDRAIVGHFSRESEIERARWRLRGRARSRRTFADPHPDDYPGRGDAA